MFLRQLAIGVDEVFLAWSVRPSLPLLSMRSSLRSLAIAEQRTQSEIDEGALFTLQSAEVRASASVSWNKRELREELATCELPLPAIASLWGIRELPRELPTRFYLRGTPRPLIVLLSGWSPTRHLGAGMVWPLRRLDTAGFDLATPVLPWTTLVGGRSTPFPGNDPCWNIATVASVVRGLGQLVRHARDRGHPAVMVMATSLGAHLAATFATRPEAELLDHLILEKPLGQLSDLIRWHARGEPNWCEHVADRLQRVYRFVNPLDRTPRIAPERVTVIGAEFDRVVPMHAAQQVADHFHVSLRPIEASHLFDPGRATRLLQNVTELRVHNAGCE